MIEADESVIMISAVFVYCCILGTKSTNSVPIEYLGFDFGQSGFTFHSRGDSTISCLRSVNQEKRPKRIGAAKPNATPIYIHMTAPFPMHRS
jgi:hypothetical protein